MPRPHLPRSLTVAAMGLALVAPAALSRGNRAGGQSQVGPVERIDVSTSGVPAEYRGLSPSISADDRFVAFSSSAGNLVDGDTNGPSEGRDVFVRDRREGTPARVSVATDGAQGNGESDT